MAKKYTLNELMKEEIKLLLLVYSALHDLSPVLLPTVLFADHYPHFLELLVLSEASSAHFCLKVFAQALCFGSLAFSRYQRGRLFLNDLS